MFKLFLYQPPSVSILLVVVKLQTNKFFLKFFKTRVEAM